MMQAIFLDVEASGLGVGSYPIEVGCAMSDGTTHCVLLRPAPNWTHWDTEAEQLHNISRKVLHRNGKDIAYVATWLNELLLDETVYSDGWSNDMCWLGVLFEEAGIQQRFKIESILTLLSEEERELWSSIHESVIRRSSIKRHRASSDAKFIQDTYAEICLRRLEAETGFAKQVSR